MAEMGQTNAKNCLKKWLKIAKNGQKLPYCLTVLGGNDQ